MLECTIHRASRAAAAFLAVGFSLWLPGPARAHNCPNFQLSMLVGQELTGVQAVVADMREVETQYDASYTGSLDVVGISPLGAFSARDAVFTLTAKAPGQAMLLVNWAYAPTAAAGACYTVINVAESGNMGPTSLLFSPNKDLPITVPSLSGPISLQMHGSVLDDGDLQGVSFCGCDPHFTPWLCDEARVEQVGTLTGGTFGTMRRYEFGGTVSLPAGEGGVLFVHVLDAAGATFESGHSLRFEPAPTWSVPGPPFKLTLNPPDGTVIKVPTSSQPVYIPVRGVIGDPDGNLLGVSLNNDPSSTLSQVGFTWHGTASGGEGGQDQGEALRLSDLFMRTSFEYDASSGAAAAPTAFYQVQALVPFTPSSTLESVPLRVEVWDADGQTVEKTRSLTLQRSADVQERSPGQVRFTSLVGTTLQVPDPTRPFTLPVNGALRDPDGDLVDVTVNGLPVPFVPTGGGSYEFTGNVILPPFYPLPGASTPAQETRATAELVVRAQDVGGRVIELHRQVVLEGGGGTATVVEERSSSLPETFVLRQNYPNPLNPGTTISYSTPGAGRVQLILFDALGQRVRILFSGEQGPGSHEVQWDGRDDAGAAVATGVYFYQLSAGSQMAVRRLTVVR